MTADQLKFLLELSRWQGVASLENLGPQMSQAENSARQGCKRKGWAYFEDGYWRMTDAGRIAIGEEISS